MTATPTPVDTAAIAARVERYDAISKDVSDSIREGFTPLSDDDLTEFMTIERRFPADIRALLSENASLREQVAALEAGVALAYLWLDENVNDIPWTGVDVWRELKPFMPTPRKRRQR